LYKFTAFLLEKQLVKETIPSGYATLESFWKPNRTFQRGKVTWKRLNNPHLLNCLATNYFRRAAPSGAALHGEEATIAFSSI